MKRIVSIQDISCIGKCSETVALPIISCMGAERQFYQHQYFQHIQPLRTLHLKTYQMNVIK